MTTSEIAAGTHRVFLLVQIDPGRAAEAHEFLQATPGISDVTATSGPFDLIALAEVAGSAGLERLVGECRRAPGLTRLSRCHAVGG
jgi:DNA-binding Lrp family transcriptional regulator